MTHNCTQGTARETPVSNESVESGEWTGPLDTTGRSRTAGNGDRRKKHQYAPLPTPSGQRWGQSWTGTGHPWTPWVQKQRLGWRRPGPLAPQPLHAQITKITHTKQHMCHGSSFVSQGAHEDVREAQDTAARGAADKTKARCSAAKTTGRNKEGADECGRGEEANARGQDGRRGGGKDCTCTYGSSPSGWPWRSQSPAASAAWRRAQQPAPHTSPSTCNHQRVQSVQAGQEEAVHEGTTQHMSRGGSTSNSQCAAATATTSATATATVPTYVSIAPSMSFAMTPQAAWDSVLGLRRDKRAKKESW
jgi:hypothetical protein